MGMKCILASHLVLCHSALPPTGDQTGRYQKSGDVSTVALLFRPKELDSQREPRVLRVAACVSATLTLSLGSWATQVPVLETDGRQKQRFLKDSMTTILLSFYFLHLGGGWTWLTPTCRPERERRKLSCITLPSTSNISLEVLMRVSPDKQLF